ncbi:DUF2878 domain-containing protein [Spartinivicinus poritis]|uniref:DUF2878 domain-containing protein n=1 Tax=Spartinivicinus poritis TaxID=2994640 RepID=A0ABT5UGG7_9GAMM|nr:DUF2878 domain-containing protein [Spartinivicinus sp. A2-2]MDE1464577.1 DUF2878 domain-containing protein [Spartinivicinus sp. A2-2]
MKNKTHALIINALLFQLGWFSCILGGNYIAVVCLATILAIHFYWIGNWQQERELLATVLLVGASIDSFWIQLGVIIKPGTQTALVPLWLACLWVIFATTLNHSLAWFKSHKLIAIPVGGIAGCACYAAGIQLTELSLSPNGQPIQGDKTTNLFYK